MNHSRNTSFVFNKAENRWYLFVHGHRIATFDCQKGDAEPETISLQGPVPKTICSRLNALDGIRAYLRNKGQIVAIRNRLWRYFRTNKAKK